LANTESLTIIQIAESLPGDPFEGYGAVWISNNGHGLLWQLSGSEASIGDQADWMMDNNTPVVPPIWSKAAAIVDTMRVCGIYDGPLTVLQRRCEITRISHKLLG